MSSEPQLDLEIEITPEIEKLLKEIGDIFDDEKIEQIARDVGFVKRKSKLTGHLFMVVFTFAMNTYGTPTLAQLVDLLKFVANVNIKREGFYQRIKDEAVDFFQAMLSQVLKVKVSELLKLDILDAFNRLIILDSTAFQLPPELAEHFRGSGGSASPSAVKIQFGYDLLSSQFFHVVQDGTCPDNSYKNGFIEQVQKGDLHIRDLGYSNVLVLIEIDQARAYYLSRLKSQVTLYIKNELGELVEFDLETFLTKIGDNVVEIELYLKKGDKSAATRLVIEAVPDELKAERLRKLNKINKKKGRVTKKRTKLWQGFNLYISNAPYQMARFTKKEWANLSENHPKVANQIGEDAREGENYVYINVKKLSNDYEVCILDLIKKATITILVATDFRRLYSIRWQIELIFKNWKSNFALDKISGKKSERIKCMIYAKLLYIFITSKIISVAKSVAWKRNRREVSELQAGQHFKVVSSEWLRIAINSPDQILNMLRKSLETLICDCLKSKQSTRTYPLDILEQIFS